MILDWRNHPDTRIGMFDSNLISLSDHKAWYRAYCSNDDLFWYVYSDENECNGVAYFKKNDVDNSAIWGFYSRPGSAKGTGFLVCSEALKIAFLDLNLNSVLGKVLHTNESSIRLHKRLGFDLIDESISVGNANKRGQMKFCLVKAKWLMLEANCDQKT